MSEPTEDEIKAFIEDVEFLVATLKELFESSDVQFFIDERNEILYVKLEGLNAYSETEIEEIASPVLDELDLDFEEIILLPL
jgi:sensor domain CHASE-containing protein